MTIRYSLLPYMYTLFYHAHTTGSTVMRALQWEYPNDPSLAGADRQFFLGPAILVTPVLNQGDTSVNGVFPGAGKGEVYYDWYNHSAITVPSPGTNISISAPLTHIPVYIRGGNILPLQEPALTTREARTKPYSLLVALSPTGSATGALYVDDGESLVQNSTLYVKFTASKYNTLSANGIGTLQDPTPLANVTVLGVPQPPPGNNGMINNVTFDGKTVPEASVRYDSTTEALSVTGLEGLTKGGAYVRDWVMQWS